MNRLDQALFARVLGDELRRLRKTRRWTRKNMLPHLDRAVSMQTLATYELGTRQIPMIRFVEICRALAAEPMDVLRAAYERVFHDEPERASGWTIDLAAAARLRAPNLAPLRQWAANRLQSLREGQPKTVHLERAAAEPLAALCGLELPDLVHRLPRPKVEPATLKERGV